MRSDVERPRRGDASQGTDAHVAVVIRRNGDAVAVSRHRNRKGVRWERDSPHRLRRRVDVEDRLSIRAGNEHVSRIEPDGSAKGAGQGDRRDPRERAGVVDFDRRRIKSRLHDREFATVRRCCRSLRHRAGANGELGFGLQNPAAGEQNRKQQAAQTEHR